MIKQWQIIFLQIITVLAGMVALVVMICLPMTEGRATNLSLIKIYCDPLIIYSYVASIPFFVSLVQVFKLLQYIGNNKVFTTPAICTLQRIKNCTWLLFVLIVGAGIYIRIWHAKDDDPAGFLALCILALLGCSIVATAAQVLANILEQGIYLQGKSDHSV